MPALVIRMRVPDTLIWWQVFAENTFARQANGARSEQYFHNAGEPCDICLLLTWDNLLRARLFLKSDDWMQTLLQAGVEEDPDYLFLESIAGFPDQLCG